jgi:alkylation response protein AidB-like acyl-CoA dehydrogenase
MFKKRSRELSSGDIDRVRSEKAQHGNEAAPAAPGEDHLARVRRIAATIEAEAEASERGLRLTATLQAALHREGLFRLLLPRPFGGFETDPPTFFRVIEEVAKHDASTAWCLCQGNGCAMAAAYLDPEIAKQIWGRDPEAVLAWGPGARSQAIVEGDGYGLSGRWSFVSGGRHASWLGGHASVIEADGAPRQGADGQGVVRTLLLPASAATWIDAWDVIGLRATGSDSYEVKDLFVRHDHSLVRDDPAERRYQAPLYLFPQMSLYASGFAATALGIARRVLDAFIELAVDKRPPLAKRTLRDTGMVQYEVAQAEARLRAARALVLSELRDNWQEVLATNALSIEDRMRIRLAATFAIHEAKAAADVAYDLAGATAIFVGSDFERRFRDIHTVTQQQQGRKAHLETVGAFLLGLPPDLDIV